MALKLAAGLKEVVRHDDWGLYATIGSKGRVKRKLI
jgi:hypothetical protein